MSIKILTFTFQSRSCCKQEEDSRKERRASFTAKNRKAVASKKKTKTPEGKEERPLQQRYCAELTLNNCCFALGFSNSLKLSVLKIVFFKFYCFELSLLCGL